MFDYATFDQTTFDWAPQAAPVASAVMAATETADTFVGGATFWYRVVTGEIGLLEFNFTGGEIGVVEQVASAGTSGVIEQALAPNPGSAVNPTVRASVSIQIF